MVELREVTFAYPGADTPIIDKLSLTVRRGEIIAIVGENGSGKSTLLKSLVGIVPVTAGSVLVGERDVTNRPPEEIARAGVGYVPQVDDVFGPLTVRENLEMGGYLLRRGRSPGTSTGSWPSSPGWARCRGGPRAS